MFTKKEKPVSCKQYSLSIDPDRYDRLRNAYPNAPFSGIVQVMMDYAEAQGFPVKSPIVSKEIPELICNTAQLEYAKHALFYMYRLREQTAEPKERKYLTDIGASITSGHLSFDDYELFINRSHSAGWDGTSQAEAPVPKDGPSRKAQKGHSLGQVRAPKIPSVDAKLKEIAAVDEEFGL